MFVNIPKSTLVFQIQFEMQEKFSVVFILFCFAQNINFSPKPIIPANGTYAVYKYLFMIYYYNVQISMNSKNFLWVCKQDICKNKL